MTDEEEQKLHDEKCEHCEYHGAAGDEEYCYHLGQYMTDLHCPCEGKDFCQKPDYKAEVERLKDLLARQRERTEIYHKALHRILEVVDDITTEEFCTYGHGDTIEECEQIDTNTKPCDAADRSVEGFVMCKIHGVFCACQFPECQEHMKLFKEDLG